MHIVYRGRVRRTHIQESWVQQLSSNARRWRWRRTQLTSHHPPPNRLIVFHYFMHERCIITNYILCEYGSAHTRSLTHSLTHTHHTLPTHTGGSFWFIPTIIVIHAHVNTLSLPVMEFFHPHFPHWVRTHANTHTHTQHTSRIQFASFAFCENTIGHPWQ